MPDLFKRNACPDRDTWSGFYAGMIDEDAVGGLAAHLDHCPVCQALLHTLGDTTSDQADVLVAELRAVSPPPDAYEIEPECRKALEQLRILIPDADENRVEQPVPERLGEYRILQLLGRGGMGDVYRAVHTRLNREVAVKIVAPERASDATAQARFHREMAALGKLDHPNVVRATDAGEANGVTYLVMDLVDGIDLSRLVRSRGALPVADACEIARQAATGLQHLAGHGLIHRDVKPSNLMVTRLGEVKILDLGLAAGSDREQGQNQITGTGQFVGTFDFLAPEQADSSSRVDCRADIYSLGCTLYYLLTGQAPYSGPNFATARNKILGHTAGVVPEVCDTRPEVPAGLSAILKRMMAKNPSDRFATPAAAAVALTAYCEGAALGHGLASAGNAALPQASPAQPARHGKRRPVSLVAAMALLALLCVGGGLTAAIRLWVLPPNDPKPTDLAAIPSTNPPQPQTTGEQEAPEQKQEAKSVYPVALLGFEERGAGTKDLAPKVGDLLFATLANKPDFYLVDRIDLKKVLDEQQLSLTGAVKADEAVKVGQLTGARILVTGSVLQVEKKLFLIAKIISTENGRVVGASVEGVASDDLATLVGKLADAVDAAIAKNGDKLAPKPVAVADRIAELGKKLGKATRPILFVQVSERHIGQPAIDPVAQTEVMRFAKVTGFELINADEGEKSKADVLVTGEGFSEVAGRVGGLVSVRARVELKAVDRKTGKVLAVDRQTVMLVDLSEQVAGKTALQNAAADLSERLLPKLVKNEKK